PNCLQNLAWGMGRVLLRIASCLRVRLQNVCNLRQCTTNHRQPPSPGHGARPLIKQSALKYRSALSAVALTPTAICLAPPSQRCTIDVALRSGSQNPIRRTSEFHGPPEIVTADCRLDGAGPEASHPGRYRDGNRVSRRSASYCHDIACRATEKGRARIC